MDSIFLFDWKCGGVIHPQGHSGCTGDERAWINSPPATLKVDTLNLRGIPYSTWATLNGARCMHWHPSYTPLYWLSLLMPSLLFPHIFRPKALVLGSTFKRNQIRQTSQRELGCQSPSYHFVTEGDCETNVDSNLSLASYKFHICRQIIWSR